MTIKKHLPNFITCLNLLSGCIGITEAFKGNLVNAALLIIAGAIFDFFDGFIARLVKASSPIGKDLDSLADVITFGLLPGVILFNLLKINGNIPLAINYIPLIVPVFSALRLAKFNNDPRQTGSFIGVPTPANALLIGSLPLITEFNSDFNLNFIINNPYFVISVSVIMSLLLISEIPLFALKFKTFNWKDNQIIYIFLLISLILLLLIKVAAIPLIVILYVILSVINNSILKKTK
ncbi:MAG: CDP-diacylglycerol--serine O-phosphatidyltransferase [Sporocytophaga sp.]|uniref:CDP-diacylglycerol--serine O-phosphatidyltransferase n=1 Tax=Sporocytophaga sp. TaxID=2231183 RepID=UPI001AFD97BF|nr:CDP-diacylglycerol--serine O-phosphatidyltransferase [Sporocytophaga sp.]MBO9702338.1 CDP-diacylglycerol--serine O-phosphatidyltransferase [Sporocytophaga sp.]